jgi:hypothetical protein
MDANSTSLTHQVATSFANNVKALLMNHTNFSAAIH